MIDEAACKFLLYLGFCLNYQTCDFHHIGNGKDLYISWLLFVVAGDPSMIWKGSRFEDIRSLLSG